VTDRRISYAQNGEDIVLARAYSEQADGFYVDVGANEPTHDSVTRYFYDRGWNGLNIEPQTDCFERLRAARPRDVNLNIGVGEKPDRLAFFFVPDAAAMSTFSAERVAKLEREGYRVERHNVQVTTLEAVFAEHVGDRTVEFLKVDIEGLEEQVLGQFDWARWRPRVVVVESTVEVSPWEQRMISTGYRRTLWDGINVFFVRDEDADELGPALSIPATTVLDSYDPWIYVEHLHRAADSVTQRLDEMRTAVDEELAGAHAAYEGTIAAISDEHAALLERYLVVATRGLAPLRPDDDERAALRELSEVLRERPDVVGRFLAHDVGAYGLLTWAAAATASEPNTSQLPPHHDVFARLARRSARVDRATAEAERVRTRVRRWRVGIANLFDRHRSRT
jgi:FkbM family methyltransferase